MAKKSKGKKSKSKAKSSAKKPKASAGKKKSKALAAKAVKTGKGASPLEVGQALVAMVKAGQYEPDAKLWAPKFSSVEGLGVNMEWSGRKAVAAKNEEFMATNIVHALKAEGPYVGATGFAVRFTVDVECRVDGSRKTMNEVGVYTVKNGKIIREEFMYGLE